MSPLEKLCVVTEIRELLAMHHPNLDPAKGCVYHATATVFTLQKHGVRAVFQAGTAMWPRIKPEEDDGVSSTHFSYVWEPDSATTALRLQNNLLPEMHAWAAIPDTQEIVDVTTKYLPRQCEERACLAWTAPQPPDFLWASADEWPDNVVYRPCILAIQCALNLLKLEYSR